MMTPPHEHSTDNIENDSSNGRSLSAEIDTSYTNQLFAIATPTSNSSMMLNDPGEENTSGSHPLSEYAMEESDQDMSDGGVPLTMSEDLRAELDPTAAENAIGENLYHAPHLQSSTGPSYTYHPSYTYPVLSQPGGSSYPSVELINTTDLPAVMSEVLQQLQHIQDGQEHGEFGSTPDEHHDTFINHNQSTSPFNSHNSLDLFSSSNSSLSDIPPDDPPGWQDLPNLPSAVQPIVTVAPNPLPEFLPPDITMEDTDVLWNLSDDHDSDYDADQLEVDNQLNMTFTSFLEDWATTSSRLSLNKTKSRAPSLTAIASHDLAKNLEPVRRCDLQGEKCDIQRINWNDLGVTRLEARQRRRNTYKNYTNLIYPNRPQLHPRRPRGVILDNDDNYFRFRQMDFQHDVFIRHFQLRNLVTCPSPDCVVYAAQTKVLHYNPTIASAPRVLMDINDPAVQPFHSFNGFQISTLASGHDIVVVGGFEGQYALTSTKALKQTNYTGGAITEHPNDITNHAQVHLSRSSSPLVTFASNDTGIRTLDVTTNKFISEHVYDDVMNCTAISPDRRLRVMVGDTRKVMISNSDTGEVLQELDGHLDYGFACDWSDDGWTVATGNQDMQVKIWDARYWNRPVTSIAADMAGVRKLKFSPLGSGRPVLVAAEPADYVSIINAETFDSRQTISFFGEIGGFDFTNDGQDLIVANCDGSRGGIFEFERCDFATEGLCGKDEQYRILMAGTKREYDSISEDLPDESPELRGTTKRREKRAALLTELGSF